MRRRAQSYRTIDGIRTNRDAVPWYWRMVAAASSLMILGGFLMLPATFDTSEGLKVNASVIGIFAVALLTAGFSLTALVCFAVRSPFFQADSIFLPALISSVLGLLTVLYNFLISSKYKWNTPALLVTVAAALSSIIYAVLLVFTRRRGSDASARGASVALGAQAQGMGLRHAHSISSGAGTWQDSTYYENYNQNMFPAAAREPQPTGYDPNHITEEEMQRQQMLMLLLQKDQHPSPDPSASTFRIDWQGRDEDEGPPPNGYYAPGSSASQTPASAYPPTAYLSQPGLTRQWAEQLRPWDGVWRGVARSGSAAAQSQRNGSREQREERRREIELGR
ncbi:hypothetical protein Tdes44962_MAKER04896 [Teratosphaeria destructans]|uniref:Uncharacterized protein n=1 Tax=Teratosphaeria destructans TaxID=418781 RepID=A0A9W7SLI4_9PEZI|nr:hypothetical protein Tdes44962_MAKER04896 [Teratosphaeria destructans]